MQFIPVDRTNQPIDQKENFVDLLQSPREIREILRTSCYDCHSHETVYPDIAYVAPISWSISYNINAARKHLNFSTWGNFNNDLKTSMLKNCVQMIKEDKMPIPGYVAQHPEAKLTPTQRKHLVTYFEGLLEKGHY